MVFKGDCTVQGRCGRSMVICRDVCIDLHVQGRYVSGRGGGNTTLIPVVWLPSGGCWTRWTSGIIFLVFWIRFIAGIPPLLALAWLPAFPPQPWSSEQLWACPADQLTEVTVCAVPRAIVQDGCMWQWFITCFYLCSFPQLDKLGLKEENVQQYKERLMAHHLHGRALAYSDRSEIKDALGMGLGEWITFSAYFFGSGPAHRPIMGEKNCVSLQDNLSRGTKMSLNISKENIFRWLGDGHWSHIGIMNDNH